MAKPSLLLVLYSKELNYVSACRGIVSKYFSGIQMSSKIFEYRAQFEIECKRRNVHYVATTSFAFMQALNSSLEGSTNDNLGTVLELDIKDHGIVRVCLLPQLKSLFTTNPGRFLMDHYTRKLAKGGILKKDPFKWEFVTPKNLDEVELLMDQSPICAVDVETTKVGRLITSCAYTWLNPDGQTTTTRVVKAEPNDYPFCITAMRKLNNTSTRKVMQNGKYDAAYFLRLNMPLRNWIFDTYHMGHAIFAELPRTLAFISSFYLDNFRYWKDEAGVNLYEYNGKDTHNTLWVFLAQMYFVQSSEYNYAIRNYLNLFPVIFPAISCAMDGLLVDEDVRVELLEKEQRRKEEAKERVNYLIGETDFNPSSPKQVKELMHAFGWPAQKTDVKTLTDWKEKKPATGRIVDCILNYRGAVKAIGTYFETDLFNQRLMYTLDPSGTETGRMASSESNFWCGTNIQNIPPYARAMIKAEEGWTFGAVDKAQSESYCTGYLSQDGNLIRAVTTSPDFHCMNASMFFGPPFEAIYDAEHINEDGTRGKVLQPALRKLAKPVNHGANYNMGPDVLLQTMGEPKVMEAKKLLGLPAKMSLRAVCAFLLERFDLAYPRIRDMEKGWYKEIIMEVLRTGKLYIAASGYTRRTFLKPTKSKLDLNTAVAHKPQSLSVHLVNQAFKKIWYELQLKKYSGKFRLKAQIHDENLFIAKDDVLEGVAKEVADMMTIPTEVEGRTMVIPSTIAKGKYWNEAK